VTPRPRKRFGQHFLIDRGAVQRIVDALSIESHEAVLEIGPGRGALTRALVQRAGRIAAVELDRDLVVELRRSFAPDRLRLHEGDVLRLRLEEVLDDLGHPEAGRAVIAGNLPYNISKPLAMKLVEDRDRVSRAVLMFQREVARRLVACPGTRDYGALTVLVGSVYEIELLFDVGPQAFRPQPKVVSSVTRWRRRGSAPPDDESLERLRDCLGACFARRRQTLRNNLRAALVSAERADALLREAAVDGALRAESVSPSEFARLGRLWG
jgi:16S rRNA (adenine1518-N6/adenine1519-N6)-dimethyltransferase